MSNMNDFVIENGVLKKYVGPGGDVVIPDGVISIGNYAFAWCDGLTGVTIPDSVKHIGEYAFQASGLTSITIPSGVVTVEEGVFWACKELISVCLSEGVKRLEMHAFSRCDKLEYILIPDSVTAIRCEFYNTKFYQKKENWENGVLYIGNHLIRADYSIQGTCLIKPGTKTIADSAFGSCCDLASVILPNTVKVIGDSAFYDCSNLTNITIPSSVTSIGNYAFSGCYQLENILIPEGVISIGEESFRDCSSLTQLVLPDSLKRIGDDVFRNCSALVSISIPDGIEGYNASVFDGCDGLTDITIRTKDEGQNVVTKSLEKVKRNKDFKISKGVLKEYRGNSKAVIVPEGVLRVKGYYSDLPPFNCDKTIESIILPSSLKKIDPTQFRYLKNLKWIECKAPVEIENEDFVFPGCKSLVYVVCNPETPLNRLPKKWKQWLAVGVTKYLSDGHSIPEEARKEARKYISSQNKKLKLYEIGYEYPFFAKYLIDEGLLTEEQYDEMITHATQIKQAELLAMLIEGKSKQFPAESTLDRAMPKMEKQIKREQDTTSASFLKTQWSWKKREDGTLIIWTYKGTDPDVTIPAMIGKNRVTAIRGGLFQSNTLERTNWMLCNLRVIRISEGITEIYNDQYWKGAISGFAQLTHVFLPKSMQIISPRAFKTTIGYDEHHCEVKGIRNVIIHAPAGSYAEQYAKENGIPFEVE